MMPASVATPIPPGPPRNLRWTVDQFHYLGDLGMFEGRRAMLIDGVIIEEGPMNPPHAIAGEKTEEAIRAVFGARWRVRVQKPLVLGQTTDPEPDVAVVQGTPQGTNTHPTTAELVVELSDTSLHFDTTTKAEWYATAGIPEYWVLDLPNRRLLVYRDPEPLPTGLGATAYRTHLTLGPTDSVSPLAAPGATIAVADLLP
ncbi:MAG TPA: Uma2 family endonuclease [Fimbriiglobus sp.]|jgi:Uma2 family endonuclease|nr:Uma2 family endonuclease [Fimbriiglobus sp.]